MNKFNSSVKQKNMSLKVIIVTAIIALFLCLAASTIVGITKEKASAAPSMDDLQMALDQTSAAYFDAMQAQQECQEKVNEANSRIDYCNERIPEVQGKISVRAKSMYVNGTGSIIDILLGSTSIGQLVNNLEAMTIMSNKDSAMVQECKSLKAEVEAQKVSLDENLAQASEQAEIASSAYNEAQGAIQAAREAAAAAAAAQQQQQQQTRNSESSGGGGYNPGTTDSSVANRALGEIGKPYIWGGVGPDGYDCSGLVSYAISGAHTRIGTTTTFMGWSRLSSPVVGCICTNSWHCGIYVGGGSMCHAPTEGQTVCVTGVQGGMIYVQ